ncbi:MAG: M56 family metallopeptidase, partial [Kangiellaceae bacterium]|nr:M56 family metallopeptidase [Kangiellaceae bacterium]
MDIFLQLIDAQVIESLALSLLHFSWQALIIACSLRIALYFIPQNRYRLRYSLSVAALISCCAAPFITYSLVSDFHEPVTLAKVVESSAITQLISPVVAESTFVQSTAGSDDWQFGLSELDVVLLWFIGVFIALAKLCWDIQKTYTMTRVGVRPVSHEIQEIADNLLEKLAVTRPVKVLKSNIVKVPVVIGWLKPTILLPIAIAVGLERQQLALVIAHELAHVKRFDFAVNLMQGFIQVIFFYHPCVYWINKIVREEREFICDSMALAALGDNQSNRLSLAKALLNTAELKQGNYSLMAVAASDGHLKKRIFRIVSSENRHLPSINSLLMLITAIVFSFTAIAATNGLSQVNFPSSSVVLSGNQSPIEAGSLIGYVDTSDATPVVKPARDSLIVSSANDKRLR